MNCKSCHQRPQALGDIYCLGCRLATNAWLASMVRFFGDNNQLNKGQGHDR